MPNYSRRENNSFWKPQNLMIRVNAARKQEIPGDLESVHHSSERIWTYGNQIPDQNVWRHCNVKNTLLSTSIWIFICLQNILANEAYFHLCPAKSHSLAKNSHFVAFMKKNFGLTVPCYKVKVFLICLNFQCYKSTTDSYLDINFCYLLDPGSRC